MVASIKNILAQDKVDLVQLNTLMSSETKVTSRFSFWGTRVVTVWEQSNEEYRQAILNFENPIIKPKAIEEINLNVLAEKVIAYAKKCTEDSTLNVNEKKAGKEIFQKLNRYYEETDELIKSSNIFSKFLFCFRELFVSICPSSSFIVKENPYKYFA